MTFQKAIILTLLVIYGQSFVLAEDAIGRWRIVKQDHYERVASPFVLVLNKDGSGQLDYDPDLVQKKTLDKINKLIDEGKASPDKFRLRLTQLKNWMKKYPLKWKLIKVKKDNFKDLPGCKGVFLVIDEFGEQEFCFSGKKALLRNLDSKGASFSLKGSYKKEKFRQTP